MAAMNLTGGGNKPDECDVEKLRAEDHDGEEENGEKLKDKDHDKGQNDSGQLPEYKTRQGQ
jgi:hypothetical protein